MSLATIETVREVAAEQSVLIRYEPQFGLLDAWSPRGMVFSVNDSHFLEHRFPDGRLLQESLADMQRDLEFGLEPCNDEECDLCIGEEANQ